jgi:hypothetical protein
LPPYGKVFGVESRRGFARERFATQPSRIVLCSGSGCQGDRSDERGASRAPIALPSGADELTEVGVGPAAVRPAAYRRGGLSHEQRAKPGSRRQHQQRPRTVRRRVTWANRHREPAHPFPGRHALDHETRRPGELDRLRVLDGLARLVEAGTRPNQTDQALPIGCARRPATPKHRARDLRASVDQTNARNADAGILLRKSDILVPAIPPLPERNRGTRVAAPEDDQYNELHRGTIG